MRSRDLFIRRSMMVLLVLTIVALMMPASIFGASRKVTVWMFVADEHVKPVRDLARKDFETKNGIQVNFVALGYAAPFTKLLTAIAAQDPNAPDIVQSAPDMAAELYSRGATLDLAKTFGAKMDPILKILPEGWVRQFRYKDALFALPQHGWLIYGWYRDDIFKDLGWTLPSTWDDVYSLVPKAQAQKKVFSYVPYFFTPDYQMNMENGVVPALAPFLYQKGGDFFNEDGTKSALDTPTGRAAFKEMTELFTKYQFPLTLDLQKSMVANEAVFSVQHDMYSAASAVWLQDSKDARKPTYKVALMPGTKKTDGTIDRSNHIFTWTYSVLKNTKDKDAALAYLAWYFSDAPQRAVYEMYNALVPGRAWFPPNKALAVELLNKYVPAAAPVVLEQGQKWAKGIRPVFGGFLTTRFVVNAFGEVVQGKKNPDAAIDSAVAEINKTLDQKQKEFAKYVR
jgi:ABC-type glycerol-3-phosphate transport system substrate-binding protein